MAMLMRADSPVQDVLDLAETSLACGDAEGALMLFGVVALERGFDDRGLAWQFETGARTGLWSTVRKDLPTDREPMLEKGQRELRELLVAFPPNKNAESTTASVSIDVESIPSIKQLPPFVDFASMRLRQLIENPVTPPVAALTAELASLTAGYRPFDLSMNAGAPVTMLVRMVVFNRLRRFARLHRELLEPPFGSAALLDHAARLSADGLGPYFSNVQRLAKDVGGLVGLLRLASGESFPPEELGRWMLLLSVGLHASRLPGFVPMLTSFINEEYLHALIARAGMSADRDTLWAVRDSCLVICRDDVAEVAQATLAAISPENWAEWMILGDFRALRGDVDAAEQTYRHSLAIRSDERQVLGRLAALQSGEIEASIFLYGFFADEAGTSR